MNFQDITSILTPLIAIYGAVLSTCNFFVQRRQNKRWLNISMSMGYGTGNGTVGELMLLVTVANPSNRPVQVSSIGALLPDNNQLLFPVTQPHLKMPTTIDDWKSVSSLANALDVAVELGEKYGEKIILRPYAIDALGKRHLGKKFTFEIKSVLPKESLERASNA